MVEYSYDAAGSKLSVKTLQGGTTEAFSNYVGGFVYEGATPALSFFSSPGGRVVKNGTAYEYQYSLADNQGNTRIIFTSVTPESYVPIATLEGGAGDNAGEFSNVSNVVTFTAANNTAGGSKVVRMNQGYAAGPSKSIKVYPGDKVDAEVWTYFESGSGYGTGSAGVAAMVTAIAAGFGGASGGAGEIGLKYDGVNSALGGFGLGGNVGDAAPAAYLNYILFDQQYKVVNMGWIRVPANASFSKKKISLSQVSVTEPGYIYVYLSYENQSNNYVYFDDFKVTHTKSNLIQGNEYYPFGMQTANSWTRENVTGNRYLANGSTELNSTTGVYDLVFRNYDPAIGRMNQVDPMASKYGSITPYNYSLNNPSNMNDPLGDDVEPQPPEGREYFCAMCWRDSESSSLYMRVSGGGMNGFSMGSNWKAGDGRSVWSRSEAAARKEIRDRKALERGEMSERAYAATNRVAWWLVYADDKADGGRSAYLYFNTNYRTDFGEKWFGAYSNQNGGVQYAGEYHHTDVGDYQKLGDAVSAEFSLSHGLGSTDHHWALSIDYGRREIGAEIARTRVPEASGLVVTYIDAGYATAGNPLKVLISHELKHTSDYILGVNKRILANLEADGVGKPYEILRAIIEARAYQESIQKAKSLNDLDLIQRQQMEYNKYLNLIPLHYVPKYLN